MNVVRVPELDGRQRARERLHLQHGDVGRRVGADDPRTPALVVGEAHVDGAGAFDHVVVRDDVAGLVDHEAGAEGLLALALGDREAEERIGRRRLDDLGGRHLDDSRRRPAVDLADGERLAALEGGRARRRRERLQLAHGGRALREGAEAGCSAQRDRAAEDCRGDKAGAERQRGTRCHESVIAASCSSPVASH